MPSKSPDTVVVAVDNNMVYALLVMLHSLRETSSAPFTVVIGYFRGKLNERYKVIVQDCASHWGIEARLEELTPHPLFTERRHLTITTFSKFVLADQIASPHLWIDIDTIARPGWDDMFSDIHKAGKKHHLVVASKLESPHTRFEGFNAGVLGWTTAPRKQWIPALAALPEKRFSSEQHLFNTLYRDSYLPVDVRFNFLSSWHAHHKELARASIVHYSGPIKPWHLARRHARRWDSINPSWRYWFEAEERMVRSVRMSPLYRDIKKLRRAALFSGRLHLGKGALAGALMRFLALAGPIGVPFVWWLQKRRTP